MPRRPLPLGTWGKITRSDKGSHWVAYARFRDYDGVTRQVERAGKTGAAAENDLKIALRDRARLRGEILTGESTVNALADMWLAEYREGGSAAGTITAYEDNLRWHIRKALGSLRLREATVPLVDRFLKSIAKSSGDATARRSKVVLSHMFSLAVRHGAMQANPMRETRVAVKKRPPVQSVTLDQVRTLRERLCEYDVGKDRGGRVRVTDLADPIDMFLGTGARTGELFAIRWQDVDFGAEPPTVEITGTVVFERGTGYKIQPHPKSDKSRRKLKLPPFVVEMLLSRRVSSQSEMVFPSSTLTLRVPNNFRRQWRAFREEYGYENWIVPKTFRKAVATEVRAHGSVDLASEQLGHSDRQVTQQHYIELSHEGPDVTSILERFAS